VRDSSLPACRQAGAQNDEKISNLKSQNYCGCKIAEGNFAASPILPAYRQAK